MTSSIKFAMADDTLVRNLKGEAVKLRDIMYYGEYPIWGILLIYDKDNILAVKQLCKGELKIKSIIPDEKFVSGFALSQHITRQSWDTEFYIGANDSLVSIIWSEYNQNRGPNFDLQAVWQNDGGFAFRNGQKEFRLDVYSRIEVYSVLFECDITSIIKEYPGSKKLYPCIPYVQTLEGQDPSTYSVHQFKGFPGCRSVTFTPLDLLPNDIETSDPPVTSDHPGPSDPSEYKGKGKKRRRRNRRRTTGKHPDGKYHRL